MSESENIIRELPTGLYRWYSFVPDCNLLYIGSRGAISEYLSKISELSEVVVTESSDIVDEEKMQRGLFTYIIISTDVFEKSKHPELILKKCRELLAEQGVLLFSVHNRLGIRYFCGDKDVYTRRIFDGIEDLYNLFSKENQELVNNGRTYDDFHIREMLSKSGFTVVNRYSVMPGLENPVMMYADEYIPKEKLISRLFPQYHYPDTVFLDEERLYDTLISNGLFHRMANAYLYECIKNSEIKENIQISDALQITNSLDRGTENALITVIHSNSTVTKKAAYDEGIKRIKALSNNMKKLKSRGIRVVEGFIEGDTYCMSYIEAETGEMYLKRLLQTDRELFISRMDEFREIIMNSSESYEASFIPPIPEDETEEECRYRMAHVRESWEDRKVLLLKEAMVDLVPLNSFLIDGEFVFFDQEMCELNFPVDYIMTRVLFIVYGYLREDKQLVSMKEMFARYGMPDGESGNTNEKWRWFQLNDQFVRNLRKERVLSEYYTKVRKNQAVVHANRQRMNYSAEAYRKLSVDILYGLGNRGIIIFGAGKYARIFLTRYGMNYPVIAAVDNAEEKQGTYLSAEGYEGGISEYNNEVTEETERVGKGKYVVSIYGPSYLKTLAHGDYRVIICVKNYISIIHQLDEMGIYEYAVYDPYREYDRTLKPIDDKNLPAKAEVLEYYGITGEIKKSQMRYGKKYHLGYTAGAFDMFHTGHVNLLRRSKEMCDYLIVGVMSDEAIRNFKGKEPVIPYEDRAAVVASCRYVDEVVEIPYMRGNSDEAWKMYHFDVQFCGSDYVGNEGRMKEKEFLEAHGAELVMFPYTEHISSSDIRTKLKKSE